MENKCQFIKNWLKHRKNWEKQIKFKLCLCIAMLGESFSFGMVTKKIEVKLRGTFIWRRDYSMCKQNSVHINQWFFPLKYSPIPITAMVNIMCLQKYLFFLFIFPWKKISFIKLRDDSGEHSFQFVPFFGVFILSFKDCTAMCTW